MATGAVAKARAASQESLFVWEGRDKTGKVVRGPAPLSLALAHVTVENDTVFISQWGETDFRTGDKPWWA